MNMPEENTFAERPLSVRGEQSCQPEVSVVIPVFNQRAFLKKTLGAVFSQHGISFEIILVDDCSTDGSAERALELSKGTGTDMKILRHHVNRGASAARNTGMENARGKSVFFLDGDDIIKEHCLFHLWTLLRQTGGDISFCAFEVADEQGKVRKKYAYPSGGGVKPGKVLLSYLRGNRWLNASNVLYDRSFLLRHSLRFPRGCLFAEDREFIVKALCCAEKAAAITEPLVGYIQHPSQSTRRLTTSRGKYAHGAAVYLRLLAWLKKNKKFPDGVKIIEEWELPNMYLKLASSFAEGGENGFFDRFRRSPRVNESLGKTWRSILYKPEVFLKFLALKFFPQNFFRHYYERSSREDG